MSSADRGLGQLAKEKGGLWERLDEQVQPDVSPGDSAAHLGIWDLVVPQSATGVWDELDRETLYLWDEEDFDTNLWLQANDETLILSKEGQLAIWQAVLARSAAEGGVAQNGSLTPAANLWQRSADETLLLSRPAESIFAQQVRARDLSTFRPQPIPGYALKRLTDARGETYWILKNLRTDTYLRLTAEQIFLWNQMDGRASVQDLAVAYMLEYGQLAINGLLVLLDQLQQKGFIEPLINVYGAADASLSRRQDRALWRRVVRGFFHTELAISGIDARITRSYRWVGRWLFTWPVRWLMAALMLVGGVGFVGLLFGLADRDVNMVSGGGASAVLSLVALYVLLILTLVIHEWSHAIATKHYGREVRRGGFLIYLGMPAAFVDTTDIWLEQRRPRMVVSWAGPQSGFVLGGLASLLILAVPVAAVQSVLYQFAVLTYLTSFWNLNPLLKLDGYYILMDWLEIPRLRERSLAFVAGPLWRKISSRDLLSRDERIFAVFGLLSALWTGIALVVVLYTLGGYLVRYALTIPGLVVIGLLVILSLVRRIWRSRRRKTG
ncbi:MAG: hypothetical protein GYB65_10035 [Chloroflexi bacterium]|nr:hypothetical protein [Chloroflexota bacterium]